MEIESFDYIMEKMCNLGIITGINIDEYVNLSNKLMNNLIIIDEININKINLKKYDNLFIQVQKYKQNSEYIKKLNKYLIYKKNELSYTLQYQRYKKLQYQIENKKNIYSNK